MSEKLNLGDHKDRLLSSQFRFSRKQSKVIFQSSNLPSYMRDKDRYQFTSCQVKS